MYTQYAHSIHITQVLTIHIYRTQQIQYAHMFMHSQSSHTTRTQSLIHLPLYSHTVNTRRGTHIRARVYTHTYAHAHVHEHAQTRTPTLTFSLIHRYVTLTHIPSPPRQTVAGAICQSVSVMGGAGQVSRLQLGPWERDKWQGVWRER